MIYSKCIKIEDKKAKYVGVDDLNIYFFSKEGFYFLFPRRDSWIEILYGLLLTYSFGALMTYFIHPNTIDYWNGTSGSTLI